MAHSLLTKKALATSLKELMETTPLNKIKVSDVTNHCGMNRQTFYYHFQDIFELLGWIYKNEAVEYIADDKTYSTWTTGFLKIFYYIENNKTFCKNTFHSLGRDHLETFLYSITHDLIISVVREISIDRAVSEKNIEFISNFYALSFIGLIVQWLKNGMKEEPEEIIQKLSLIIKGNIEKGLQELEKKL